MWRFSESVNEYLGKELVTKENETEFLFAFKRACEDQINLEEYKDESDGRYEATIEVMGEKLAIVYDIDIDEDGVLSTIDEEIVIR